MNSVQRQYLFGLIFFGVGVYELTLKDYIEFSLYIMAGLSFIVNALTFEPRLESYKILLVRITWILIGITALLFLYMVQFKWF